MCYYCYKCLRQVTYKEQRFMFALSRGESSPWLDNAFFLEGLKKASMFSKTVFKENSLYGQEVKESKEQG